MKETEIKSTQDSAKEKEDEQTSEFHYRDKIKAFIDAVYEIDCKKRTSFKRLYNSYKKWLYQANQPCLIRKDFEKIMRLKGYSQQNSDRIKYWKGLAIKKNKNTDN